MGTIVSCAGLGITFDKVYAIPFYAKLNLPNERKDFRLAWAVMTNFGRWTVIF